MISLINHGFPVIIYPNGCSRMFMELSCSIYGWIVQLPVEALQIGEGVPFQTAVVEGLRSQH